MVDKKPWILGGQDQKPLFFHRSWGAHGISATVDGSEIRRSPVEVGSLSHYLQGLEHIQTVVVGDF